MKIGSKSAHIPAQPNWKPTKRYQSPKGHDGQPPVTQPKPLQVNWSSNHVHDLSYSSHWVDRRSQGGEWPVAGPFPNAGAANPGTQATGGQTALFKQK